MLGTSYARVSFFQILGSNLLEERWMLPSIPYYDTPGGVGGNDFGHFRRTELIYKYDQTHFDQSSYCLPENKVIQIDARFYGVVVLLMGFWVVLIFMEQKLKQARGGSQQRLES